MRLQKRWRFSAGELAPAVLSLLVTGAVVAVFVLWVTIDIDRRALQRQTVLAGNVLSDQIEKIPFEQESIAIWDDAVENLALHFDQAWADANVGVWMHEYYGHDHIVVFDERNQPIYTMSHGVSPAPALVEAEKPQLLRMVLEMRSNLAAGALRAYSEGTEEYPHVVDVLEVRGQPAVVSVVPIIPDSDRIVQEPGAEYLHVVVRYLDQELADALGTRYLLEAPRFARNADPRTSIGAYPISNRAGEVVTSLQWRAYRPGEAMVEKTTPVLIGAFAIGAILILALVDRLWKSSAALDAGRISAQYQATHDPLTELPNRSYFEQRLDEALTDAARTGGQVVLMMLDLDRFKKINDTLGHQAGDDLIRAAGQRLRELLEPSAVLARLGGDEFAIITTGPGSAPRAPDLARRIITALSKPFVVAGSEVFIGVSIGIAMASNAPDDHLELTRKADIALYEAKQTGRNRAIFYEDAMYELLQSRHTIEAELREALRADDQLDVAYQPLFDCVSGKMTGAEALVRWKSPRLGLVSPAHFIPIAEGCGLIEAVGDFVLRRTCALGARWPGLTFAVNISPAQLRNPRFASKVFDILEVTGMRPEDLELEITESILLEDERAATTAIAECRAAGIKIALDDFGTGYSSLNYLKRYPVDRIKIDRSFVSQLARKSTSSAIVQAMVTLSHALGIAVTAEGVETQEQMNILVEMGCNTLQGFLLAAPTTSPLLEAMFRDHAGAERQDNLPVARVA